MKNNFLKLKKKLEECHWLTFSQISLIPGLIKISSVLLPTFAFICCDITHTVASGKPHCLIMRE